MKKRSYLYLILTILMTLFIFTQSIMPGEVSSSQSGFFTTLIQDFLSFININIKRETLSFLVRKLAHFTEFFFFGLFLFMFLKSLNYSYKSYFITFHYGLMVGITDELIQNLVPNRAMQGLDVLIDASGVLFFLLIAYILSKIKTKQTS